MRCRICSLRYETDIVSRKYLHIDVERDADIDRYVSIYTDVDIDTDIRVDIDTDRYR